MTLARRRRLHEERAEGGAIGGRRRPAVLHATWAVGYLVVAAAWWPAAVIAVGVWTTGWLRGRGAVRTYAMLVESTVDVNKAALARRLELLQEEESFNSAAGHRITDVLRKAT